MNLQTPNKRLVCETVELHKYPNQDLFSILLYMKNSKITFEKKEDQITVKIIGEISATTEFPKLETVSDKSKILLLLDEAGYVNSSGIQGWIRWLQEIQKLAPNAKFMIQMLPANFAKLSSNIRDFFPKQSKVESFVAPYFCEKCNTSFNVIFKKGSNWQSEWTGAELVQKISTAACTCCGTTAEIDTPVEAYQNF